MIVITSFAIALFVAGAVVRTIKQPMTIPPSVELPDDPEAVFKWDKEFFNRDREYRYDPHLMLRPAPHGWH